jgi:hypothetical protein
MTSDLRSGLQKENPIVSIMVEILVKPLVARVVGVARLIVFHIQAA